LDGLEAVEMQLSKVLNDENLRLESSFWSAKNDKNIQTIKGVEIIDLAQYGTSKELNERNEGYLTLRINEFDSIFISSPFKSCNLLTKDDYESLKLKTGDVLISRTNGNPNLVGKAAVVMEDKSFVYASYLFKIRPKENIINSEVLTVFINSKYGRNEINKYSMTSNQTNFSPAKFREIDIPIFSIELQNKVKHNVMISYIRLQDSKSLYTQAETLLLKTLGLDNFTPSNQSINIKSFKDSFAATGRLDAEYYQPKYESYEQLITSKQHTVVSNEYIHVTTISKKDKEGYNYIEIGDVNVGDGSHKSNYVLAEDLPANAKTLVKKGDILISNVRPYRGAVTIIDKEDDSLIVSGAFTVLREKKESIFNTEVLKVLLRSRIYKDWLLKFNIGTSYPVIKDDDVLNIPIPIIDLNIQAQIAELVQQSFALKKESEQLLEKAKQAVELAIEQGEDVAMGYLGETP
jgi:restriction endonuclease S subunit